MMAKTCGIRTYPHIRRIVFHTVHNGYKRIATAGEVSHAVLRKVRIAVLPQQRTSVGVTLPEITAEVQAESGPALPKDTMAAIKANKVRFIAKKFYR